MSSFKPLAWYLQHTNRVYILGWLIWNRFSLKWQVDDFEVMVSNACTANIIFDAFNEQLTFPLEHMGLVTMFTGLDLLQTKYWIKVACATYIDWISKKFLANWMSLKISRTKLCLYPPARLPWKNSWKLSVQTTRIHNNHLQKRWGSNTGMATRLYRKCVLKINMFWTTQNVPENIHDLPLAPQYSTTTN